MYLAESFHSILDMLTHYVNKLSSPALTTRCSYIFKITNRSFTHQRPSTVRLTFCTTDFQYVVPTHVKVWIVHDMRLTSQKCRRLPSNSSPRRTNEWIHKKSDFSSPLIPQKESEPISSDGGFATPWARPEWNTITRLLELRGAHSFLWRASGANLPKRQVSGSLGLLTFQKRK